MMLQGSRFKSKKEFVYEILREGILEGELAPGERIVIDDVATETGVSHIPVREALQMLESDGFVTIEPYVGAKVTDLHAESIKEVFTLLEALETISAQAACQRMTEDDLDEAEEHVRHMDTLTGDPEEWSTHNIELHLLICKKAGMPLVQDLFSRVTTHWNRLRRYYVSDVFSHTLSTAQKEHWELLEALRSREPETVARTVRSHNRRALSGYLDYLSKQTTDQT